MITFNFTLLLSFNASARAATATTLLKKSRSALSKEKKSQSRTEIIEPRKEYELHTGPLIASVRIEYDLLPRKLKYGIDIICWKNLAKISSTHGSHYYRTLQFNGKLWVPVTLYHYINTFNEDDLSELHSHSMTFQIITLTKEITSRSSYLFCFADEAKSAGFVEYFDYDPNKSVGKKRGVDEMSKSSSKGVSNYSMTTYFKFAGTSHESIVNDAIATLERGEKIKCKDYLPTSKPVMNRKISEKRMSVVDKHKSLDMAKNKDPHFLVPGEIFFADPKLAVYKLKEANSVVTDGYIFLSVQNLMTRDQKCSLNPLIIKIKSLKGFPASLLKQHGYKKICISYEIPNLVQYESLMKSVDETIYFEDCHAYLTKNITKTKYLEFIRNNRLKVKVKGVKEQEEKKIIPRLFGTLKEDVNFSKRLRPRQASEILRKKNPMSNIQILAVATYDISSLLKNVWIYREAVPLHHPDNLLHGLDAEKEKPFANVRAMAEIYQGLAYENKSVSPLMEGILSECCSTLDMEFAFVAPQFAPYHLQQNINAFKRLFFILYSRSLATHILAQILQHNEDIIGFNAIILDPVNLAEDNAKIEIQKRNAQRMQGASDESWKDFDDVITGFLIDSGKEVHIYAEGVAYGYILEIWNKIHKADIKFAKIFLNSETDFEERLYIDFQAIGMLNIILKKPLEDLFKEQAIYVKGSIPLQCFRALQKLNLLLQTDTFGRMLKLDLFPTGNELVSLSLEYGVPLKMYK